MRVATRRMRSALKEARRLLDPDWVRETRSELKWLGGLLGDVRDPDVFTGYVERRGRAHRRRRAAGRCRPRAAHPRRIRCPRAHALPRRSTRRAIWRCWSASRRSARACRWARSSDSLERALRRAARRAQRKLRRLSSSSQDEDLHKRASRPSGRATPAELAQSVAGRPAKRSPNARPRCRRSSASTRTPSSPGTADDLFGRGRPAAAFVAGRLAERQARPPHGRRAPHVPSAAKRFARVARAL